MTKNAEEGVRDEDVISSQSSPYPSSLCVDTASRGDRYSVNLIDEIDDYSKYLMAFMVSTLSEFMSFVGK